MKLTITVLMLIMVQLQVQGAQIFSSFSGDYAESVDIYEPEPDFTFFDCDIGPESDICGGDGGFVLLSIFLSPLEGNIEARVSTTGETVFDEESNPVGFLFSEGVARGIFSVTQTFQVYGSSPQPSFFTLASGAVDVVEGTADLNFFIDGVHTSLCGLCLLNRGERYTVEVVGSFFIFGSGGNADLARISYAFSDDLFPVPEPSQVASLASGLAFLLAGRKLVGRR